MPLTEIAPSATAPLPEDEFVAPGAPPGPVGAPPSDPPTPPVASAAPARGAARANRAATLLSTAGDEAGTSLLPAFLSGTLGAAPVVLGVVEGLANAADGIARLVGGPLSEDPRRRRRISLGGYAGMAGLSTLVAFATSSWQVGALRAGASTARGLRSPQRYAAVPERVGAGGYGRVFGVERSVHHLAAVIGPLLAFALLALADVRTALLGAVIPGMLAIGLGLVVVRRSPAAVPTGRPARLEARAVYRGPLGRFMTGLTLFELANFAAVLLILRATKLLAEGDVPFGAAEMAVLLYLLWRLGAAASCVLAGRIVDRSGPVLVMTAGVLMLLVAYGGFAFIGAGIPELAACFLLAGAASGTVEAAEHVGVAQLAPEELRWSAFGSLSAVRSFGRMTATLVAATVWTLLGPEYGLLFAAPLMIAAVVVMARGVAPTARQRGPRRRPHVAWLLVLVAAAAVATVVTGRDAIDSGPPSAGGADAPGRTAAGPPPADVVIVRVGRGPDGVAFDATTGTVLVTDARDGTLTRLDGATGRTVGRPVPAGADPDGIAVERDAVWVAAAGEDGVRRLDGRRPDRPALRIATGRRPEGIALGAQLVWVANGGDGTLTRLDRATGSVVGPPVAVGTEPTGVAVADGRVWVTDRADGTITQLDAATARIVGTPVRVGGAPRGVVVAGGSVWVADAGDDTVVRLDPRTGRRRGAPIEVGDNPRDLAAGDGTVWVANHGDGTVTALDARSGRPRGAAIAVGRGPLGIAVGAGAAWVANHDDGTVSRVRLTDAG